MIVMASGRSDICAFYAEWFANRIKAGYVDVRNPFYASQVSRIEWKDVEAIVFCTKNPKPMMPYLNEINIPYLMQVSITPYGKEMEPNVLNKREVIACVKQIAKQNGRQFVSVRYDPIFINEKYTIRYHCVMFERLCKQLEGCIETIIISFIDMKKNTVEKSNRYGLYEMSEQQVHALSKALGDIAKRYAIQLQTCAEDYDLSAYGITQESCISKTLMNALLHNTTNYKKGRLREFCHCIQTVDIAAYNTCSHYCRYCYANYEERKVKENALQHNPQSSLLIGELKPEDQIKIRKK